MTAATIAAVFLAGLLVGSCVGLFAGALCVIAGQSATKDDEESADDHKGWCMAKLSSEYECDCAE